MDRREFIKSSAIVGATIGLFSPVPYLHRTPAALNEPEDFSAAMVQGVHRFLDGETRRIKESRADGWEYDFSSEESFRSSTAPQRELLTHRLGVVDERPASPSLEVLTGDDLKPFTVESDSCLLHAVRWQALEGRYHPLRAEGILLQPRGKVTARVVLLPDADMLPEVTAGLQKRGAGRFGISGFSGESLGNPGSGATGPVFVEAGSDMTGSGPSGFEKVAAGSSGTSGLQAGAPGSGTPGSGGSAFGEAGSGVAGYREEEHVPAGFGAARRLAGAGLEVLIPVLADRQDTYSGSDVVGRYTNQPHREWIYRQGFNLGRHIIGYELQKVFAAIDWFQARGAAEGPPVRLGVAGYGEGGLLALQAAALDSRITSTLISGYFDVREEVWKEPIYRNVLGLLQYYGDAELAVMAWPRKVVIEHAEFPEVPGPPAESDGRSGAAPGRITTPETARAKAEWERAVELLPAGRNHLQWHDERGEAFKEPFSPAVMGAFAAGLDPAAPEESPSAVPAIEVERWVDVHQRQKRTVRGMEYHAQRVLALSEETRDRTFWDTLQVKQTPEGRRSDVEAQKPVKESHRERFRDVIGRLPSPSVPADPHVTLKEETQKWSRYEVRLDVWPGVMAGGMLLVPAGLNGEEEQRPAVVCQHGLNGVPMDTITRDPDTRAYEVYRGFASRLAERGYLTFSPQDLYRGGDDFRQLTRKANPLGLSLYSFIAGQHRRIVEWLGGLSYVDPGRIALYGLSYGGKTAMRVTPLVEGYAVTICAGDFNEWIRKIASTDFDAFNSYMFTREYEIFEWNLGQTFNYAEMAALIAPRPFMVERGHYDGVGTDEWVNYEFAKVRRHYAYLGLQKSVDIEHFNGGHRINAERAFEFLEEHI